MTFEVNRMWTNYDAVYEVMNVLVEDSDTNVVLVLIKA